MTRFLLDGYAIVSEWIQENKVHNEDRIQEVLQVSQEIDSLIMYRRLCIDLAEHPSPGRMISIYFISEGVKEHLMKRITGWSQTEYQAQSMLRRLLMFFTTRGRRYHATLREIECVKITAIQFAFLKLQRNK